MIRTPTESRDAVRWTEAEWDDLAEKVAVMRMNEPTTPFGTLINKAQASMPERRRRKLATAKQHQPLVKRIAAVYERIRESAREVQAYRDRLATYKTADEILDGLSDQEVLNRFGHRVLRLLTPEQLVSGLTTEQVLEAVPADRLAGEAARRLVAELLASPIRRMTLAPQSQETVLPRHRGRFPKVAIVGAKPNQQQEIIRAIGNIADLKFYANDATSIPPADIVVSWVRFINHNTAAAAKAVAPPGFLVEHFGGVERLISAAQQKIEEWFHRIGPEVLNGVSHSKHN